MEGHKDRSSGNTSYNRPRDNSYQSWTPETRNSNVGYKKTSDEIDKANVKCYGCGKTGHYHKHCPEGQSIKTGKRNDTCPPGAKSFNVNVTTDLQADMASATVAPDTTEVYYVNIETMMCDVPEQEEDFHPFLDSYGAHVDYDKRDALLDVNITNTVAMVAHEQYDPFYEKSDRISMGSPMCEVITAELNAARPYPGDPKNEATFERRFYVYECNAGKNIVVLDRATLEDVILPYDTGIAATFRSATWYAIRRAQLSNTRIHRLERWWFRTQKYRNHYAAKAAWIINGGRNYADCSGMSSTEVVTARKTLCFNVFHNACWNNYVVINYYTGITFPLATDILHNYWFVADTWFERAVIANIRASVEKHDSYYLMIGIAGLFDDEEAEGERTDTDSENSWYAHKDHYDTEESSLCSADYSNEQHIQTKMKLAEVFLSGTYADNSTEPALQRNSAVTKDPARIVPKLITIIINVNGQPARALVDTGSLCDFMSTSLVDQLKLKKETLATPLKVQLAVQGSRSMVNHKTTVNIAYQGIKELRTFDVMNISNYDIILGTPFLYQHRIMVGFNETCIMVGSNESLPIQGVAVKNLSSHTAQIEEHALEEARTDLRKLAEPLCKTAGETPLPPLCAINHRIELIEDHKVYPWRAAKCPEAFLEQWCDKRNAYISTGRWETTTTRNTVPMMFITKPGKPGEPRKLRTVIDLRARNENTKRLTSPLPDIDGIMRRVAAKKYRSILDFKDAYEQVRIEPADVWKTAFATPNGNMLSHVLQQGDTNAPATYQTLMNYLFSPYIGKFLDVYLDDIVIYSDLLDEHIEHVKIVLQILLKDKLYLSAAKLEFLCKSVKILGRIVDDEGIQMDPYKVDAIVRWKTPTTRELLRGFLGAAGYLADDIDRVR